jgi:RNA methyltransferase, TrmH family
LAQSPSDSIITSLHNPAIKRARSLLRRKGRTEERAFLVEGVRAVTDAVETGVSPEIIYLRDDDEGWTLYEQWEEQYSLRFATEPVIQSLSDVPNPQSVVAVFAMGDLDSRPRHDTWETDLILVADGVRDPGNMGTLIRTAAGAGITEFIISPDSVDPFNPKCVRAAMGAHFLVSLRPLPLPEIHERLERLEIVALATADGDQFYDDLDWTRPSAIIVGSEAFGANQSLRVAANAYVRIPLARGLESLNAGVAGSHLVLEAARQRRPGSMRQELVR